MWLLLRLTPLAGVPGGRRWLLLPLLVVDPGLLGVDLVRVVVEVLPAEEEAELGVVPLLRLGHLLELGAVAGHELSQLVDDVPHLGVSRRRGRRRRARVHLFPEKLKTAVRSFFCDVCLEIICCTHSTAFPVLLQPSAAELNLRLLSNFMI